MKVKTVLAVDLGAESGRVMAVHFDGQGLRVEELHRFANRPVRARGTLYWDALGLWAEIQAGVEKGRALRPASLGVDTWGVDFGLLDAQGRLLGNPVHYRDGRTAGMMERVFARVPREEIFRRTGIQFMALNTLYQLRSLVESDSPQLQTAATLLTMPDLFHYWLTGARVSEYTIASTTQLLDARTRMWDIDLVERAGIPARILPEIVPPGTRLGEYEGIPVIAPACHDTASAVAAVPAANERFAYVSSGTWSLAGLEVREPVISPQALDANVTNEGGVNGTLRLLKNISGMWIIQQCRAAWAAQGQPLSYPELTRLAEQAESLPGRFDPDDARFFSAGSDYPQRVRDWYLERGLAAPASVGQVVRCVLEGLAARYADTFELLRGLAGFAPEQVHLIGGGSRNELQSQLTANLTGLPVVAGPVEATVLGNALVQLIALGEVRDLAEGRALLAASQELTRYSSHP